MSDEVTITISTCENGDLRFETDYGKVADVDNPESLSHPQVAAMLLIDYIKNFPENTEVPND